jgi:hypothetical protein
VVLAHGFRLDLLVELIRGGLATAKAQRVRAGRREMRVTYMKITDAGRRALGA